MHNAYCIDVDRRKAKKNGFIRENAKNMFYGVGRVKDFWVSFSETPLVHIVQHFFHSAKCSLWANFYYSLFSVSLLNLLHVLIILVIIFLENGRFEFHFLFLFTSHTLIISLVHPLTPSLLSFSTPPFTLFFCISSFEVFFLLCYY